MKILSAIYRIPYQNLVGDVGFYTYQQVYPFYAFALVLSTYGFPVIISKLLAEQKEKRSGYSRSEILFVGWFSLSIVGITLFSLLFFGANNIAHFLNDPSLEKSIKIIAFTFLFLPVASIFKGLFQSEGEMVPTAISQVTEQTVRVGFILIFAFIFYLYNTNVYAVAEGAFLGSVIGSAVGSIVLIISYIVKKQKFQRTFDYIQLRKNGIAISKDILWQGFLFSFSSLILVFIQFMDTAVLYPILSKMEIQEQAKALKGIYDRGQPLIQLGTTATIALSLTIVPLISKFREQNDFERVEKYSELALRLSLVMGTAAAIGLFWVMEPTNIVLFTDKEGSAALSVLALSIFFCSLLMTGIFLIQSMGRQLVSIVIIGFGLLIKFILMVYLVPKLGIMGAAISTTGAFLVMVILLILYVRRIYDKSIIKVDSVILIVQAAATMSVALFILHLLFKMFNGYFGEARLLVTIQLFISIGTGAFIYISMIIRRGLFTIEELALLPFGSKLAKFLPKDR